ncbi:MAG: hypothetical protein ACI8RD_010657 [Bacillariaceae sp.]|jgi:hypothetical protein
MLDTVVGNALRSGAGETGRDSFELRSKGIIIYHPAGIAINANVTTPKIVLKSKEAYL